LTALSLLALSLISCSAAAPEASKSNWIDGPCSIEHPGVTLSVDFKGAVTTRCAKGFDGDGWGLFAAAGFLVQGTDRYPTAFACKIDNQPAEAKCDDSDSTGAYWGYYLPVNGTWGYATTGASDHKSKCGSWEGWVYMENEKTVSHLPQPTEFACS